MFSVLECLDVLYSFLKGLGLFLGFTAFTLFL